MAGCRPPVAVSDQVVLRTWKKMCPSGAFGYPTIKNVNKLWFQVLTVLTIKCVCVCFSMKLWDNQQFMKNYPELTSVSSNSMDFYHWLKDTDENRSELVLPSTCFPAPSTGCCWTQLGHSLWECGAGSCDLGAECVHQHHHPAMATDSLCSLQLSYMSLYLCIHTHMSHIYIYIRIDNIHIHTHG